MATKQDRVIIDKIFVLLGVVTATVLLVIGSLSWYGYSFATKMVRDELSAQKIYFPAKGDPALNPKEFPGLQKYAGQQVDDGIKAKAYANEFIGKHLENIADGKTYSEVSALAKQDSTNQQLQQQKQALFQGETLRGLLLGDGYAYWTFGTIAMYAAIVSFAGAAIMIVLVLLGLRRIK